MFNWNLLTYSLLRLMLYVVPLWSDTVRGLRTRADARQGDYCLVCCNVCFSSVGVFRKKTVSVYIWSHR